MNEQAFANPWEFNIPVSGFGFLSGLNTYPPLAYSNYYLTTLNPGQEGISYSAIFGGQTASPLYVSQDNYSSMMGYYPNTSYIFAPNINQTLQQHSTDIGFGSNNSYVAIYDNYNNSATYTSKTLYSTTVDGFTNYSVYYGGNNLHFAINGNSILNTTTNLSSPDLMTSSVGTGSMNTIYSLVLNTTAGNANINIGRASVFQAYLEGLPVQNPVYTNTSVIFSSFSTGIGNSNSIWKINNESFKGQFVAYRFKMPGNYTIQLTSKNKIYNLTEEVVSKPTSSNAIKTCFLGTGSHVISTAGGSGVYFWYVNGKYVKDNSSKLIYNFPYQGYYTIKVFVLNSYGSYTYSYIVNVKKQSTLLTVEDVMLLMYNTLLPIISIIYLLDNRFKSIVNKNFIRFLRLLVRKV